MSRIAAETSTPSSVLSGLRLISSGNSVPSFRSPKGCWSAPMRRAWGRAKKAPRCAGCFSRKRSGTRISTGRPASSSGECPNSFCACVLTRTISPPRFITTTASGAASSNARNFASATSLNCVTRKLSSALRRSVTSQFTPVILCGFPASSQYTFPRAERSRTALSGHTTRNSMLYSARCSTAVEACSCTRSRSSGCTRARNPSNVFGNCPTGSPNSAGEFSSASIRFRAMSQLQTAIPEALNARRKRSSLSASALPVASNASSLRLRSVMSCRSATK